MKTLVIYAILTIMLFSGIGYNIGYFYGKRNGERPINLQYETNKIKLYEVLDKVGSPLNEEQKKKISQEFYKKDAVGF